MAKGKKLKLTELKVQSFETELDSKTERNVKGGCPSFPYQSCPNPTIWETGLPICCRFYDKV
jgi:hypothetical protein